MFLVIFFLVIFYKTPQNYNKEAKGVLYTPDFLFSNIILEISQRPLASENLQMVSAYSVIIPYCINIDL